MMKKIIQNNKKYLSLLINLELQNWRKKIISKICFEFFSFKVNHKRTISVFDQSEAAGYQSQLSNKTISLPPKLKTINIGVDNNYDGTWNFEMSDNNITMQLTW